jgi:hypothetical protein
MISVVPLVLGANLWMVAVGVPLAVGSAGQGSTELLALGVALFGVVLLGLGTWRKNEKLLLIAFPVAALAPQALWSSGERPMIAQAPWPMLLASLLAHLLAVTYQFAEAERAGEPVGGQAQIKALPREQVPTRWRRRLRVYRGFTMVASLFPLTLLGYAMSSPSVRAALQQQFGSTAPRAHTLLCAGVGLLWLIVLRGYLLAPLGAHLQHDRDLIQYAEGARKQARRGRPRAVFYLFVLMALAAMVLTVWQRSR